MTFNSDKYSVDNPVDRAMRRPERALTRDPEMTTMTRAQTTNQMDIGMSVFG